MKKYAYFRWRSAYADSDDKITHLLCKECNEYKKLDNYEKSNTTPSRYKWKCNDCLNCKRDYDLWCRFQTVKTEYKHLKKYIDEKRIIFLKKSTNTK